MLRGTRRVCRGKKHHTELADHKVKLRVTEGQLHCVRNLEIDVFAIREFTFGYFKHRRVEIGNQKRSLRRQLVAKFSAYYAGPGRQFDDVHRRAIATCVGQPVSEIHEENWAEAVVIIMCRNVSYELG